MRVAVAVQDEATISTHFGRSAGWLVYNVDGEEIGKEGLRANTHTHHAHAGGCHGGGSDAGPHSHVGIISALKGCDAVICGAMGWRAAEDLKWNGITPLVVDRNRTPEQTVKLYAAGELESAGQGFCSGRPHGH